MYNVYVTPEQLDIIKDLVGEWDNHARWLPQLEKYLWEESIPVCPEAQQSDPSSYRFLAGGVDHIEGDAHSVTIHDRCLQTGGDTLDGSTRFTTYMTESDTPMHGNLTDDDLVALYHEGAPLTEAQWERIEKLLY